MSELSASELMQKLAMSRAAQSAASSAANSLAVAREAATKRGTAYRVPQSSRESIMSPSGASVSGGNDEAYVVPRARLNALAKVYVPSRSPRLAAGFNSFMGDAMGGWKEELLSAKFRQAILAEFVATGALFVRTCKCAVTGGWW